ncbi:MAG: type II secretion system GspH family protein [Campylobacteraceae bacterium]|jgi:general secretion pathway protein G|nr:type II secretion system GspH family protein [Campylobacteraceae bacterium]
MKRSAFTMIELVFIIAVLGILSSIAVSKFAATRDDAMYTKGKADVSAIRSSIALIRNQNLLTGNPKFPDNLTTSKNSELFDVILDYPIKAVDATRPGWRMDNEDYIFRTEGKDIKFTYDATTGVFTCVGKNSDNRSKELCTQLTQ